MSRWIVTTAEVGTNDFGGQVFKRGPYYFAHAWDHREGYGPLLRPMKAHKSYAAAVAAADKWLAARPLRKKERRRP